MAEKDGEPEVDLDLDPPEDGDDTEQQDLQVEEQDDEPEGEEVDASQPQEGDRQEQRQQPSRGERRFQTLSNDLQESRRREAELKARLDAMLATQPRQTQGETPEARAQRRALLTAEERITEDLREAEVKHSRDMQSIQFAVADGNDKAAFSAKATVDPLFRKWEPKVEAELVTLRNQGMTAPREKIMYYLIGKAAVEGRQGTRETQRAQGARRIQRQTTRSGDSRSDVAPQRRQSSSLERRLENEAL